VNPTADQLRRDFEAAARAGHRHCATLAERFEINDAKVFRGICGDKHTRAPQPIAHMMRRQRSQEFNALVIPGDALERKSHGAVAHDPRSQSRVLVQYIADGWQQPVHVLGVMQAANKCDRHPFCRCLPRCFKEDWMHGVVDHRIDTQTEYRAQV